MNALGSMGQGSEGRVFELVDRVVFRVSGADALRYLNGQVTQDLRRLRMGEGLGACVTTAKGKLQAVVRVALAREGGLWVEVEAELGASLLARLERYVVADDVLIEEVSERWSLLHVLGRAPGEDPVFGGLEVVRMDRLGEPGWDVWIPREESAGRAEGWGERRGTPEEWEGLRVARGIPAWGRELDEDTLPPEAGLDRTHIDYHKGCYVGQEVLSRLKSVGRVNRTLVRLRGEGMDKEFRGLAEGGSRLMALAGQGEVGRVTSAVGEKGGGLVALGYVKRGVEETEFEAEGLGRLVRVF